MFCLIAWTADDAATGVMSMISMMPLKFILRIKVITRILVILLSTLVT